MRHSLLHTSVSLAAIVGAFAVGTTALIRGDFPSLREQSLANGQWQQSVEREFDAASPLTTPASQAFNALQVAIFGQIQGDVLIGKDQWLFSETEFKVGENFEENLSTNMDTVAAYVAAAKELGLEVEVVIIPDKARLVPDLFARPRSNLVEKRYEALLGGLRARSVPVFDALSSLVELQTNQSAFLKTDTHWRPEGAIAVALDISAASILPPLDGGKTLMALEERSHDGDLYRLLDLGPYQSSLGFAGETITIYGLSASDDALGLDLFGNGPDPIHLVGTSFSAFTAWSFADALEASFGRHVINKAQAGYGPIKPMADYLDAFSQNEGVPALLIWEIPEKYMSLPESEMAERADAEV